MKYDEIISALKSGNLPISFVQESFINYDSKNAEDSLSYLVNNDGEVSVKLLDGELFLDINVMN